MQRNQDTTFCQNLNRGVDSVFYIITTFPKSRCVDAIINFFTWNSKVFVNSFNFCELWLEILVRPMGTRAWWSSIWVFTITITPVSHTSESYQWNHTSESYQWSHTSETFVDNIYNSTFILCGWCKNSAINCELSSLCV